MPNMKTTLLFLFSFTFYFLGQAQCDKRFEDVLSDTFVLHKDVVYGSNISSTGETVTLLADIFEPSFASETPRPMVILIHGGGFFGGSKEMKEVVWICEDLARRGVVTASISYRLEPDILSLAAPEKMIKAVIRGAEDAKAVVRFFHKSAAEDNPYSIDPDYIFIGGTSAGSIAALHAVFMDDFNEIPENYQQWVVELGIEEDLLGNSGSEGFSNKVAGVINISGALKTPAFMENNADVPLLSIHNDVDLTIDYQWGHPYQIPFLPLVAGSYTLHQKMKSLGGYSDLYTIQEINHVPHTLPNGMKHYPVYFKTMDRINQFLRHVIPCADLPTPVLENISNTIRIYPNPVTNTINLEGIEVQNFALELFQTDGKKVQMDLNSDNLDVSQLPRGTYFLKGIDKSNGTYFSKVVVLQ
jgi:acetyl esterase/lipase